MRPRVVHQVGPPSLAALASSPSSANPWQLSALRPPLKTVYARPAASGCTGSRCAAPSPFASFRCPPWFVLACKIRRSLNRRWLWRCHQSTPWQLSACRPPLAGLYARPAASGCTGSHCVAPSPFASFRCPPLSVLPCKTRRSLNLPRLRAPPCGACGLRQPAPGRRPSTAQRAAPRPPALIMTVLTWRCSSGKRWYDAAVQAQMPRPGGSVRGQKGASGLPGYTAAEKVHCPSAGASHHAG
ncbi:uncharacterized protein EpC_31650 [Erwinia pyrifoliae Ep1/96]|nr:uncharacterized protein EpC_31650 [Erwinia pyrifoliae Ep1/96]